MFRNILLFLLLSGLPCQILAGEQSNSDDFNAGEYFMEHVVDSYGWHITSINKKDITISLPIILIDKGKIICFMSSEFQRGKRAYKGYALGFTEKTKGKIIKLQGKDEGYSGLIKKHKDYSWTTKFIDISISKNVCSLFISIIILCIVFLSIARVYKRNPIHAPKGFQCMLEVVVIFIRDEIAIPLIGEQKYHRYLFYLLTLFFFILLNNLMGIIPIFPGGANVTGNIAVTMILALISFLTVSFSSKKSYWLHIINPPGVPWWLKFPFPLMPIIELFGVLTKPFVLMIRLFANMTAGHIIALGFMGLIFILGAKSPIAGFLISPISIFFYVFMGTIEILVAFIQAFIFTLLTALYIGIAIEEAHA